MFDFANQAYTLLIVTVLFGALFTQVIVGERNDGYRLANLLWSVALAASYLLVVCTAPLLGAMMDFSAAKKRFLFVSYVITVAATALLYFVAPGYVFLGIVLIVLSNYAYAVGESFIASFLPDLGPPEDLGKISGFGWALGYIGGLVSAAVAILYLGEVSAANFERIRWVGPFAAAFFLVAAIPTFLWVRERGAAQSLPPNRSYVGVGVERLASTLRNLRRFRDLAVFFGSLFFMMAGIYIVIAFTFIYGAQVIGWDEATRNRMFVVVQVTAAAGALVFGFIQERVGARNTYNGTLLLWILAIAAIYFTPQVTIWLNAATAAEWTPQDTFLVVGCLAGLSLGSSQSAGRALVGILSPTTRAAEFFGFWGVTSKLAACFGLFGIGLLQSWIGLHASMLFCLALFATAIALALFVDERRGRRNAELRERREAARTIRAETGRLRSDSGPTRSRKGLGSEDGP
jgi:MFS transporter, UMF1 family